jgi:hypothetical protein
MGSGLEFCLFLWITKAACHHMSYPQKKAKLKT